MPIDHDQIFKKLIEAFFEEFMELFCPDEAALMDFGRVEFVREEIFTDTVAGVSRRLDLTAKVGLKSGGERFVLVHGEFEASRGGRDFPRRMFRYLRPKAARTPESRILAIDPGLSGRCGTA